MKINPKHTTVDVASLSFNNTSLEVLTFNDALVYTIIVHDTAAPEYDEDGTLCAREPLQIIHGTESMDCFYAAVYRMIAAWCEALDNEYESVAIPPNYISEIVDTIHNLIFNT